MNVRQLREAIKDLPGDLPVSAWTSGGDNEFEIRIATLYERPPVIKPCLFLGDDPTEFTGRYEKLLYTDEVEGGP